MTSHYCKDSQIASLKLFSIVTHFANFKHNFSKEIETFFKNKLKWIQEICFKINPLSSELQFHIYDCNMCLAVRTTKWILKNTPASSSFSPGDGFNKFVV